MNESDKNTGEPITEAFFPWRLYVNNHEMGDEANSIDDVFRILSRAGVKFVARTGAEIKFVDILGCTVLQIKNGVFVYPPEVAGERYV